MIQSAPGELPSSIPPKIFNAAFSPGSTYAISGREKIIVQFDNTRGAFFWSIAAAEVQSVLQHTNWNVAVDAGLRIAGTERRTSGLVIRARIVDYAIYSTR